MFLHFCTWLKSLQDLCHVQRLGPEKGNDEVRDGAREPRRSVHPGRHCWKLAGFHRRGNILLENDDFQSFKKKKGKWATVSPVDSVLARIHQAETNVFSDSVFCAREEARCGKLQEHLNTGGWTIAKKVDQTPKKAPAEFLDCAQESSRGSMLKELVALRVPDPNEKSYATTFARVEKRFWQVVEDEVEDGHFKEVESSFRGTSAANAIYSCITVKITPAGL